MVAKKLLNPLVLVVFLASGALANKPERSSGHEQLSGWVTNSVQSLEFGVLLEVEGFASKIGGENQSDILLATVAFDVEAAMNDWLLGHIGLLWEQYSREDDNIDEAYIALGASDDIPFYVVAGRFYQPVGNFESAFISDPFTLELVEMNTESVMAGYGNGWMDFNVGALKGDVQKSDIVVPPAEYEGDSTISDFYASINFKPIEQVTFGAYWLSDLMEGYNQIGIGEEISQQPGYEKDGAAGAFINGYIGLLTLNAEYVSALQGYTLSGGTYVPAALNLEGSVQVHEKVALGLKYGASNDLYAAYDRAILQFGDKFPGQAFGAVISYAFQQYATLAAEYLHVEELDNQDSGDIVTLQLGLTF